MGSVPVILALNSRPGITVEAICIRIKITNVITNE